MKILQLLIIGLICTTAFSMSSHLYAKSSPTGLTYKTIYHDKQTRSYYLHLPSHKSTTKRPLLLVLHGGGKADGDETAAHTGYNQLADKYGFIVAYPNGLDSQWNDGRGRSYRNKSNASTDDVGFISKLIDKLITTHNGNPSKVYITGISNGGMMTQRLACEISGKLAGIASVISNMPQNIINQCRPKKPLSVLLMNGTKDPIVPWHGGDVKFFRRKMGKLISTAETINFWVTNNRCNPNPSIELLPNNNKRDRSRVRVSYYGNCDGRSEVILYAIEGGGHAFPKSHAPELPRILGRKNKDINGSEVIMDFFRKH